MDDIHNRRRNWRNSSGSVRLWRVAKKVSIFCCILNIEPLNKTVKKWNDFQHESRPKNLEYVQKYFHCVVYVSPQSFFDFINVIMANCHLSQWLPVQSPHTSMAICFGGIMKSSENVIVGIVHCVNQLL